MLGASNFKMEVRKTGVDDSRNAGATQHALVILIMNQSEPTSEARGGNASTLDLYVLLLKSRQRHGHWEHEWQVIHRFKVEVKPNARYVEGHVARFLAKESDVERKWHGQHVVRMERIKRVASLVWEYSYARRFKNRDSPNLVNYRSTEAIGQLSE